MNKNHFEVIKAPSRPLQPNTIMPFAGGIMNLIQVFNPVGLVISFFNHKKDMKIIKAEIEKMRRGFTLAHHQINADLERDLTELLNRRNAFQLIMNALRDNTGKNHFENIDCMKQMSMLTAYITDPEVKHSKKLVALQSQQILSDILSRNTDQNLLMYKEAVTIFHLIALPANKKPPLLPENWEAAS